MHLIIDVGNTQIKLAVFKARELIDKRTSTKEDLLNTLSEILKSHHKISNGIISSVGGLVKDQISEINRQLPLLVLNHETKIPFINSYATPKTLGVDRIALVSAAAIQFPKEDVFIIDAGSCITYDFLSHQNEYLGGAIAPGIQMRYKAMHTFTANLPLLEAEKPNNTIGDSTIQSMHVGVIQGVSNEIDGFIDTYIEKTRNLTVILTGGDAHFLRDRIKNNIFANSNFLLEGLNYILEINKDSC